jgi:tRNA dimethylallyltransferase
VGPTASGKSAVAVEIAQETGAEILSVDSMQVYRGMDIGTAKPTAAERRAVPHHMIDLVEPSEPYSVAEFQGTGRRVLSEIERRSGSVLIVGGSGLHFRALVDPLVFPPSDPRVRAEIEELAPGESAAALLAADPEAADHVDMANPRRVMRALEVYRITGRTPAARAVAPEAVAVREYRPLLPFAAVGLDPGDLLPARVERRFDGMLERGLLDEVGWLAPRLGPTARQAVGYKQLLPVAAGERPLEAGRRRAIDATRSLAGRQRTFFRRDPRIRWIRWHDDAERRRAAVLHALREAGWIS